MTYPGDAVWHPPEGPAPPSGPAPAGAPVAPQGPAPGGPAPPSGPVPPGRPGPGEGPYHRLLRTPTYRWWRPLLGLLLLTVVVVGIAIALLIPLFVIDIVAAVVSGTEPALDEESLDADSPWLFLLVNLTLAGGILAAFAAVFVVHRVRIGVVSSIIGRVRWRLLRRAVLLALAVVVPALLLYLVLPGDSSGDAAASTGWPGVSTFAALAAVALLTTPLQAAGEEYVFRGYLTQALGCWLRSPWGPALITALLFALAHGTQGPWLFLDRLAFGLVASWLVLRTGGLEAPIALHAVNNVLGVILAAALGEFEATLMATDVPFVVLVVDLVMLGAFMWLVRRDTVVREQAVKAQA